MADNGKKFRRKKDKVIVGEALMLGRNETIDEYEEIDNNL